MKYWWILSSIPLLLFFSACKTTTDEKIERKKTVINDPVLKELANCNRLISCKVATDSENGIFEIEPKKLLSRNVEDIKRILLSFTNKQNHRNDYPGAGIKEEFLISSSNTAFLLRVINYDYLCVIERVDFDGKKISMNTNNFDPSEMRIVSSEKLVGFLKKMKEE